MKNVEIKKYISGTKSLIHTSEYIKNDIIDHLMKKEPFSLVRIGDGDLSFLNFCIQEIKKNGNLKNLSNDDLMWRITSQGVRPDKVEDVLNMYRESLNEANYISSFEIYIGRKKGQIKKKLLGSWQLIYEEIGVKNKKYCEPDVSFFLFNDIKLLEFIKKNKYKLCLITSFEEKDLLNLKNFGLEIKIINIPKRNILKNKKLRGKFKKELSSKELHIDKYDKISNEIILECKNSDIFFVAGGMLGRSYTNIVKKNGKISIDLGKMIDYWVKPGIPGRFNNSISIKDNFTINLKNRNKEAFG